MSFFLSLIVNFWGAIYSVTYFGEVNATNGWGFIYPTNADGSLLRVDTTMETSDVTYITIDQTKY